MTEFVQYFIECKNKTIIIYEEKIEEINENYKKIIEQEFINNLITYEGRKEAIIKRWGLMYNTPILINDKICFIKINDNIWVNYFKIEKITKESYIYLSGGGYIQSNIKYRSLKKKIEKIEDILAELKIKK